MYSNHGLEAARRRRAAPDWRARPQVTDRQPNNRMPPPCSISVPFCTYGNAQKWAETIITVNSKCVLGVESPCNAGWGIFHATDLSLAHSLRPSSLPECSMEVSPVREKEGGRGCGYVRKLETPPGESHYGKHSSQASQRNFPGENSKNVFKI